MGADSSIQWTHHTLNPWRGCSKVHAGCTNCYAERNVGVKMAGITWGEVWHGGQRVVAADSAWEHPPRWARAAAKAGKRHRVFCASLADVLEVPTYPPSGLAALPDRVRMLEAVDAARSALDGARSRLWEAIRETAYCGVDARGRLERFTPTRADAALRIGGLDWLLLTKRPENWRLVPDDVRRLVWLGTSISGQKTANEWVPRLLAAEGFRLRFLSIEPLVGPVDLTRIPGEIGVGLHSYDALRGRNIHHDDGDQWTPAPKVDWVIVGGESGPKARPCNVEWVRDIVRQCREAGVPCFVKQLGSVWAREHDARMPDGEPDTHGGNWDNWPADLRVREFPCVEKDNASRQASLF